MVAIIGGAGAGKSLPLRSLSNYIPTSLNVQKDVLPVHIRTGFVPTEDILIGELTVRETLRYSAQLRCPNEPSAEREARLQQLIDDFGLGKVADNQIGTVLKRGISGGQKRRVSVLVECAAQPDLLLLDEPTSGLDSSTALSVCQSIARLAKQRNSVAMATLQQPNTRLLEQFHQVVVMNAGHVVFIGAVGEMQQWFAKLGYSLPSEGAISDHVASLLGSDKRAVAVAARLHKQTYRPQESREQTSWGAGTRPAASSAIATTLSAKLLWNQYAVLTRRFAVVAQRSLPLYWLQFLLVSGFGFLIGVVFWQLPFVAGARINNLPNGLTWLVYVASYIQVFRVFYQADMRDRYRHEKDTNLSFNVLAWSMADLTVTSIGVLLAFIPGLLIALFMMGVPFSSIGYSVLVLWTTAMTTEALLTIIVQLVQDVPYAVLVSQGVLVLSSVFAGGAFIGFDRVDHNFWVWLQDISLYNFASRAIEMFVFQRLSYTCNTASSANECLLATYSIPCATASSANGVCELNGLDVLAGTTGLTQIEPWLNYGVLIALFVAFRAITVVIQALRPMQFISKLRVGASTMLTAGDVEVAPVSFAKADCNNSMHSINATHLAIDVDPGVKSPAVESSYDKTRDRQATVSVLEWTDVELRLRSNKQSLVTGMSGYTVSGQLLAILGGSGAEPTPL